MATKLGLLVAGDARKPMMSRQDRTAFMLVVILVIATPSVNTQNLRDLAREQARRNPGVTLNYPAPPEDFPKKTLEELTKEASVVVRATLSFKESYLSPREDTILTGYLMRDIEVIGGNLLDLMSQTPGSGVQLVLTVVGGDVRVEGLLIRGTDNNREAIMDDGQYLLFLKESQRSAPGRYVIYNGGIFEVAQNNFKPLVKHPEYVFTDITNGAVVDVIDRIQKAARPSVR
jgi:hypothetical protein